MNASKYRHILWALIGASDTGKYDSLSAEEVAAAAESGNIQAFLASSFAPEDLDVSLIGSEDWQTINEAWASLANAVDARRKFGVENRGVSLLMAYTLECLQRLQPLEA
jgi:hypothetical protein